METKTEYETEVTVEVTKPSIREGFATFYVQKIWGMLDTKHRGDKLSGGMVWIPDGKLPVGIPVDGTTLTTEQLSVVFKDLIGTLLPTIATFVEHVDAKDDDF